MQKCRNHKHAQRKGQHALTILTAQSSRRHSPARCRSGSSSTSSCPRPGHSQHAATHPRFYPCHPQPPYPPKYTHRLQRNINAEMQKPQTRTEKGQHALTTLTAYSSRRHSPARCRSGSSSTSTCPRPDTVSMQPRIHASTHAIRSPHTPRNTTTAAEEHQCRNAETHKHAERKANMHSQL